MRVALVFVCVAIAEKSQVHALRKSFKSSFLASALKRSHYLVKMPNDSVLRSILDCISCIQIHQGVPNIRTCIQWNSGVLQDGEVSVCKNILAKTMIVRCEFNQGGPLLTSMLMCSKGRYCDKCCNIYVDWGIDEGECVVQLFVTQNVRAGDSLRCVCACGKKKGISQQ